MSDGQGATNPLSVADIIDEIWLEVGRHHADAAKMRDMPGLLVAGNQPTVTVSAAFDLPGLLRLDGQPFIEAAYATLLGRSADPDGSVHLAEKLAAGHSKVEILGQLQSSAEARAARRALPGLQRRYLAHRLYRLPILGPCIHLSAAVLRRTGLSRVLGGRVPAVAVLRAEVAASLAGLTAEMERNRQMLEAQLAEQRAAVDLATRRLATMQTAQDEFGRRIRSVLADQERLLAGLATQDAGFARQLTATEENAIDALRSLYDSVTRHEARLASLETVRQQAAAPAPPQRDAPRLTLAARTG